MISDSAEFFGLRLVHENQHHEELRILSGPFATVAKQDLVNAVKQWLYSQRVVCDEERIWHALRVVGAQKSAIYAGLDRLGL